MIRSTRLFLSMGLMLLLASSLQIACGGGDECQTSKDCASKGKDYECRVGADKLKKCQKKKTDTNKCDPECGANQECVDGACKDKVDPNKCDPACKADETCKNGQCEKNNTGDCKEDKDCAAGETCKSGKCEKAPDDKCKNNSDCKDNEECKAEKCVKKASGCNPACKADETCKNGRCEKNNTGSGKDVGEKCEGQTTPCKTGLICVTVSQGQSFCFRECTNNANACKADGKSCEALLTNRSVCVAVSDENGPCDLTGKTQAICKRNAELVCDQGTCKKGTKVKTYEKCAGLKICESTDRCLPVSQGQSFGFCFKRCKAGAKCANGADCRVSQGQQDGFCPIVGTGKEGDACDAQLDTTGDKLDVSRSCSQGNSCVNGKCKKNEEKGAYEKCGVDGRTCKQGFTCLLLESGASFGYCLTNCDPKNNQCAGGARCLELNNGGGACAVVGTAKEGAACKDLDTKADKLNVGERCEGTLACVNGKCSKPTTVGLNEKCGINGRQCDSTKAVCLLLARGASFGYCLAKCDPKNNQCAGGAECLALNNGGGACGIIGTAESDAECGNQTADKAEPSKACKKGLSCVNFGRSVCMNFWQGDCKTPGKSCPTGRVCLGLSSGSNTFGGCFSSCKAGKCAKSHLECRAQSNNTCWPKPPTGNVEYAKKCKTQGGANELCKAGLTCQPLQQNATDGFCTKACASNSDCPKAKDSAGKDITLTCLSSANVCVATCDQPGQTCPDTLKCINNQVCGP